MIRKAGNVHARLDNWTMQNLKKMEEVMSESESDVVRCSINYTYAMMEAHGVIR